MESKKKWYKWTYLQNRKETQRLRKRTSGFRVGRVVRQFGMDMYTVLYSKWITQKGLLYSTWNNGTLLNVMGQSGWEGSLRENGYMSMYGWVSWLFTWNYHNIVNWIYFSITWAPLVAQTVKNSPAMRETWVQFLGWEDPLEEGMATYSSILAWRIPMDRGDWWATSPWGRKESDTTEWLSAHTHNITLKV